MPSVSLHLYRKMCILQNALIEEIHEYAPSWHIHTQFTTLLSWARKKNPLLKMTVLLFNIILCKHCESFIRLISFHATYCTNRLLTVPNPKCWKAWSFLPWKDKTVQRGQRFVQRSNMCQSQLKDRVYQHGIHKHGRENKKS